MFFPLLFLAAYRLPGGLASTLQATSPLAVMAFAALVIGERAGLIRLAAAGVGIVGVALLVLRSPGHLDTLGLLAAFGSVVVSALGFVLVKRWTPPVDMLTLVSWQLVAGGLALLPVTLLVEGPPPHLDTPAVGWLPLADDRRHRRRVLVLVHRSAGDARRRGVTDRPGQPGRRHGASASIVAGEAFGWLQAARDGAGAGRRGRGRSARHGCLGTSSGGCQAAPYTSPLRGDVCRHSSLIFRLASSPSARLSGSGPGPGWRRAWCRSRSPGTGSCPGCRSGCRSRRCRW